MNCREYLKSICPTISVGLLTADLMNLGRELATIEDAGVKIAHFDVMDGCFAPALTVGPGFIKGVKTRLLKDVHLMVTEPVEKLPPYVQAGADMITVHIESTHHIHRALQLLQHAKNVNDPERGIARGLALNPGTPLAALEGLLGEVDIVFLLAVNPGWSGQSFIEATVEKLAALKELIRRWGRPVLTGLDGGITRENIERLAGCGADVIVTGSAVFDGRAARENAEYMLGAVANNIGK